MNVESYGRQTVLVGPWGGQEGHYWDDGVYSTIRQVEISHGGVVIDSIRIEYDIKGRSIWSPIHGGRGGAKIDNVRLDYPDEYLTSVNGYFGSLHERGPMFVRALTLESNKRRYGPFGVEQGTYFAFPKVEGRIVGFLGKSGWYLDAIGAYIEPLQTDMAPNPNPIYYSQQHVSNATDHKYEYSMIQGSLGANYDLIVAVRQKDDRTSSNPATLSPHNPITLSPHNSHDYTYSGTKNGGGVQRSDEKRIERLPSSNINGVVTSGPWGGGGGSTFDDGVYDGVRQINLSRNVCIVALRVCYEQNEQPVWGSKNGGTGAFKTDKIVFDYPSEILTHLTGYLGPPMMVGPSVIKSLTFHTTKGKHGPYGEEEGESFSTKLKEGSMIVGFHGRKGLFLDAIGVHVLEGRIAATPSSTAGVANSATSYCKKTTLSPISNTTKSSNKAALAAKKAESSEWPFKFGMRGQTDEGVQHRMVKDPAPYGPGPWGGEGGKPWDDGVFTGIKQIILTITDAICCMEIEYDRNGQSVWSVKHGGGGGQTANRVEGRYEEYSNHMDDLVQSFEAVAGLGAGKSYTTLALLAMSKHFCRLRNSILAQIHLTKQKLVKDVPKIGSRLSQLSLFDQNRAILHNSAHAWRPLRGLPETSVTILRAWLFEHFLHPYPNDSEKLMLAAQTGLSKNQVSNWFINARVRLWKPMIEEMYKEEFEDQSSTESDQFVDQ